MSKLTSFPQVTALAGRHMKRHANPAITSLRRDQSASRPASCPTANRSGVIAVFTD